MAYSNNIISAPVSIYDVQRCFARTSPDLGTLIIQSNINKWAKYKPVIFATVKQLTAAQWLTANYGISKIPTWQKLDYMAEFLLSTNRGGLDQLKWPECDYGQGSLSMEYWDYIKPDGGASDPFRMTDFDNYYHLAEQPLGIVKNNTVEIEPYGSMTIFFNYGIQNARSLKLSDLSWPGSDSISINDMYLGAIMKKASGPLSNLTYAVISKISGNYVTIGNAPAHEWKVYIDKDFINENFAGTWKIFPIISQEPFDLTSGLSSHTGEKFIAPVTDIPPDVTVSITYAEILITHYNGYKDTTSQQKWARFVFELKSPETKPDLPRNYSITVTLRYSDGTPISGYTGRTTGQIVTNATGTATDSATVNIYIADIWNTQIYYTVELVITDDLKFKRTSNVSLTGPIQEQSPQQ